jgi:hypothetical protein
MSMKLMAWLGDVEDEIGHAEFRVLFRLCWHCNERDLLCCPSVDDLVRGAGMSKSSVLRSLKSLEERCFIQVERDRWDNGTQKNNRYLILADVSITLPGGRKVDLSPTAEQRFRRSRVSPATPGENSRVSNKPGVTGDTTPGVNGDTHYEQGRQNKEDSPPLSSREAPPEPGFDLVMEESTPDLIDHVQAEWAKLKADFPRIAGIRALTEDRKKKIRARAAALAVPGPGGVTPHQVWDEMFRAIRGSKFMRGEAEPGRGYDRPFILTLDKLLEPKFFVTQLEKAAIHAADTVASSDPRTGREYGPAEQSGRAVLDRILARHQRRAG